MKTFALLFLLLSSHNFIFSQHKFEKSGVIITTNSIEVRDKNSTEFGWIFEIAQIENSTKTKKKISFHVDIYYDGICSNCGNKEYQFSFNLEPGEIIKGNLTDRTSGGLKYFKEDKSRRISAVLSDLQLTAFTVE
jgi:hypothetical protein